MTGSPDPHPLLRGRRSAADRSRRPGLLGQGLSRRGRVRPAVEQPEDPHPGPAQALAGLRRAPRVAVLVPVGPRLPARRRGPARRVGLAAQPPMADMGRSGCRNDGSSMPWPGRLRRHRPHPLIGELLIGGAGPQRGAQIGLGPGEQAVAQLAVGGQPDPVAGAAERLADRGDDADRDTRCPRPGTARPERSRAAPGRRSSSTSVTCADSRSRISSAVIISVRLPGVLGVQRHLLDEPELHAGAHRPLQQRVRLVVVDAAQQHGVDLDREQTRSHRRLDPGQHVGAAAAAG